MPECYTIYLVRHAIAAERGDEYPDDGKRPLTPDGAARFRKVARGLAALDPTVDLVLTSPLVRARQTAEILSEHLASHPPVAETSALLPGAAFSDLVAELGGHARRSGIALVGHEPGIGASAARLIGVRGALEFRKGGICRVDVDSLPPAGPGRLVWFAPPKVLSRVGR
jgi:phosphohistidine phosphatase